MNEHWLWRHVPLIVSRDMNGAPTQWELVTDHEVAPEVTVFDVYDAGHDGPVRFGQCTCGLKAFGILAR